MTIKDTALLTSTYLGPIEYYQKLVEFTNIKLEQYDHYIKQTYRNRCSIIGPEGVQNLIVPIVKPSTNKQCMKDIKIAEHDNWQHQHWQAIKTAYKNSPYFDYFEEDFIKFYHTKQHYLLDLNNNLQEVVCSHINITPNIKLTKQYITEPTANEVDFREIIHPKKDYTIEDPSFVAKRYYQVFEQKHGFIPNLSILDLLFNM